MRIPAIRGIIDRRILANYHIDPEVVARILPRPFVPQIVNGWAIGGICLIRLKAIRPRLFPFPVGIGSENAAHRFAVEWSDEGQLKQGVYIPRRDTSSWLNSAAGGTVFPGVHHRADFEVQETSDHVSVKMISRDGNAQLHVAGKIYPGFPDSSVFGSLEEASNFFQNGSLGYSVTRSPGRFDGIELRCQNWAMDNLNIDKMESSWFQDNSVFPAGSIQYDCALLMRRIDHEWHGLDDLCCPAADVD
jgi:hypothetical protein